MMYVHRGWVTEPNRTDQTWFTHIICTLTYADLHKLSMLVQQTTDRDEIKTILYTVSKEPSLCALNDPVHQHDALNLLSPILNALEVAVQLETIHVTGAWQFFFNALLTVNFQRTIVHLDLSTEAIHSSENDSGFWQELSSRAAPAFLKGIRVRNDAQRWTSVTCLRDMIAATKHLPQLTLTCSETHAQTCVCERCDDLLELMCAEGYHGLDHPEVCLDNMAVSASILIPYLLRQRNMRKINFKQVKLIPLHPYDDNLGMPAEASAWDDVLHTLAKCRALREFVMDDLYECYAGTGFWACTTASLYRSYETMSRDLHQRGGRVLYWTRTVWGCGVSRGRGIFEVGWL
jgi:hypothetical protein